MSLHKTQNLETIISLWQDLMTKLVSSFGSKNFILHAHCTCFMCHRCHQEQAGCHSSQKKKIVLAHVKKKNSQAVRLKHATASAFAESLPSMPQLLLPQHPFHSREWKSSSPGLYYPSAAAAAAVYGSSAHGRLPYPTCAR